MIDKIKRIISTQVDVPIEEIGTETEISSLGGDSLDDVEILLTLEEVFDISIPDVDAENLKTVQAIVDYLKKRGIE